MEAAASGFGPRPARTPTVFGSTRTTFSGQVRCLLTTRVGALSAARGLASLEFEAEVDPEKIDIKVEGGKASMKFVVN